ncbi:RnfH family protein [Acinetobacter sp. B5B]|uniref:RnfH family protein n=1 Tax=Acinetobacter baretiae TaxID=2605383 RepID=UPI0018C250FC|nr:RnfH family protein [Acinetobacter baretiae]MBF7683502.1 RnfH family protein [Acinetobacter baretiae]MBF7684808.1 RnfH family protein [Acinetobacter baretiae]
MNDVWVAYASESQQYYIHVDFHSGMTIQDAIDASDIVSKANLELPLCVGIFGEKMLSLAHTLQEGDRVEIYRPLMINPKDIRRNRAQQKPMQTRAQKESNRFKR